MELVEPRRTGDQSTISALLMALFAVSLGYAIHLNDGFYSAKGLLWLTVSLLLCAAAILLPAVREGEWLRSSSLVWVLAAAIALQTIPLMAQSSRPLARMGIGIISLLGLLQLFDLRRLRVPLTIIMAAAFFCAAVVGIKRFGEPHIDVYTWQQRTSAALMHGSNPYEVRIPADVLFYGPGVVDQSGYLTCAFPYPPLSLLMVLPGFVLGGDIRYSQLIAVAVSAVLMGLARPGRVGRIGALAGALFLTTPWGFYVLVKAWTEPLLVLNFSLVMFCACRWRNGLPWALGLFLATKQYAVLVLPLLPLLVQGQAPERWKESRAIVIKAGILVAAINLPFLLWNVREFTRAVVLLRAVASFRTDAFSYMAWMYWKTGRVPSAWIPLLVVVFAIALALRYGKRSPAGFAAALTLVYVLFFAFSKQGVGNYYYFAIATACWSVAAARLPESGADQEAVAI